MVLNRKRPSKAANFKLLSQLLTDVFLFTPNQLTRPKIKNRYFSKKQFIKLGRVV